MTKKNDWIYAALGKAFLQAVIFVGVMFLFFRFLYKDEKPVDFYLILFAAMCTVFFIGQIITSQNERKKIADEIHQSTLKK